MSYVLVVDNSKGEEVRKMTPKIYEFLSSLSIPFRSIYLYHHINDIRWSEVICVILSGSSDRISQTVSLTPRIALNLKALSISKELEIPVLGICFGFQVMCLSQGAKIIKRWSSLHQFRPTIVSKGVSSFFYHCNDIVQHIPSSFSTIGWCTDDCEPTVISHKIHPWVGVQFHPEASLDDGHLLLFNFIRFSLTRLINVIHTRN